VTLDAQLEFDELNDIIGAILGSRTGALTSPTAVARAAGEPYDPQRFERFQELHGALLRWTATPRPMPHQSACWSVVVVADAQRRAVRAAEVAGACIPQATAHLRADLAKGAGGAPIW
jgi:hypothetical protein